MSPSSHDLREWPGEVSAQNQSALTPLRQAPLLTTVWGLCCPEGSPLPMRSGHLPWVCSFFCAPAPILISHCSHLCLRNIAPLCHACASSLPPSALTWKLQQMDTAFPHDSQHSVSPLKTLQRFFLPLGINPNSPPWPVWGPSPALQSHHRPPCHAHQTRPQHPPFMPTFARPSARNVLLT